VLYSNIEDAYGYFDIDREGLLVVGWAVKPLGHRAGKYSNTNTLIDTHRILEVYVLHHPHKDISYTDISDTRKHPYTEI
jgi:hypothetical protein